MGSGGLQNGEIRKTGPVGGHLLGQIWPNRPQSGALSGLSCPRAGQDRPGPAGSPRGPRNGQICPPPGGVYILGSGVVLGLQYMGKHIGNPLRNMPGFLVVFGPVFALFCVFHGTPRTPTGPVWEASGAVLPLSGPVLTRLGAPPLNGPNITGGRFY